MMGAHIKIDASALIAAGKRLSAGFNGRLPKAIADGLNEGGDKVRTRTQRALQVQTGAVKYKTITGAVRTIRAVPGELATYTLRVSGKAQPINEFKASAKRGAGGGVVAFPWAVEHKFKRSFALGSGAGAVFKARTTSKRFPVRKLYGPNLAKEAVKDATAATFLAASRVEIPPIILKRMGRALGV